MAPAPAPGTTRACSASPSSWTGVYAAAALRQSRPDATIDTSSASSPGLATDRGAAAAAASVWLALRPVHVGLLLLWRLWAFVVHLGSRHAAGFPLVPLPLGRPHWLPGNSVVDWPSAPTCSFSGGSTFNTSSTGLPRCDDAGAVLLAAVACAVLLLLAQTSSWLGRVALCGVPRSPHAG